VEPYVESFFNPGETEVHYVVFETHRVAFNTRQEADTFLHGESEVVSTKIAQDTDGNWFVTVTLSVIPLAQSRHRLRHSITW
jgi:hypothetical protein